MGDDAPLGEQEAAVRLEERGHVRRDSERRMPPAELPSVDELVPEIVGDAGLERGLDQGGAHVDVAGHMEELLARRGLELAPELVRPLKEGHVADALGVGEPDDARDAVRRAHRVRDVEALEPEDALPAPGEVEAGRAPHRPDPGDDHVVVPFGHRLHSSASGERIGRGDSPARRSGAESRNDAARFVPEPLPAKPFAVTRRLRGTATVRARAAEQHVVALELVAEAATEAVERDSSGRSEKGSTLPQSSQITWW